MQNQLRCTASVKCVECRVFIAHFLKISLDLELHYDTTVEIYSTRYDGSSTRMYRQGILSILQLYSKSVQYRRQPAPRCWVYTGYKRAPAKQVKYTAAAPPTSFL